VKKFNLITILQVMGLIYMGLATVFATDIFTNPKQYMTFLLLLSGVVLLLTGLYIKSKNINKQSNY